MYIKLVQKSSTKNESLQNYNVNQFLQIEFEDCERVTIITVFK